MNLAIYISESSLVGFSDLVSIIALSIIINPVGKVMAIAFNEYWISHPTIIYGSILINSVYNYLAISLLISIASNVFLFIIN